MFDKIVFYNFYHKGDIFVSRSFVSFIIDHIPSNEYIYYHLNGSKILKDLPILKYSLLNLPEDYRYKGWHLENNTLYCNTWYNAFNQEEFNGCTIQTLFNIFRRGLKETINYDLPGEPINYLPVIDYTYYKLDGIMKFLRDEQRLNTILIANNDVWSGQSENFDFSPIINYISEIFPQIIFVITNKDHRIIERKNIYYAQNIIKVPGDDDNLNEISYLSEYCDIIIGRNSGPHTFCFTKENLFNPLKTFICFSHESFGIISFVKAEMICNQNYTIGNVTSIIEDTIRKRIC